MAKGAGQEGSRLSECLPLMEAPGFAQRVRSVIPAQACVAAPALDHPVNRGNPQRLPSLSGGEQRRVAVDRPVNREPGRQSGHDDGVYRDCPVPMRLALFEIEPVPGSQIIHLTDRQRKQLIGPVGRVDAEGEQAQIARLVVEVYLDASDRFQLPDRLDLDG